jgi:hypothetical protein
MDRHEPARRTGHQLQKAGALFEKIPHKAVFIADKDGK